MTTRVIPASENGYARGWLAQYRHSGLWFDIGDPVDTREEAQRKADWPQRNQEDA